MSLAGGVAFAKTPADTLVIAKVIDDAISFDPAESYEDTSSEVLHNTYETLVEYDAADISKLSGGIAESWSFSADNKTVTFRLRSGMTFASGNPVTANDVVYSFTRVVKADKTPAFILKQFGWSGESVGTMIKAVDDQTFEMTIAVDYAPSLVLNILSSVNASVVDSKTVIANEKDGDFGLAYLKDKSEGSGPFVLKTWKPNQTVMLQSNPAYRQGEPAMKRVILRHVPEAASQRLLLEKGDVDIASNLPGDQIAALEGNADIAISRNNTTRNLYIGLSQTVEPFTEPKVREALKYLVDYKGMTESLLKGEFTVLQSFWPSGFYASVDENPYSYDVEKAKALLAEAGYKDGFAFRLSVRNVSPAIDIAQAVEQSMSAAGIKMEILQTDQKQFITAYRERQFEAALGTWEPDFLDPHANAATFAHNLDNGPSASTKTVAWRNSWKDDTINALTDAAVRESDETKRIEMYKDLQRKVMADGPYIGLVQRTSQVAMRSNVKDYVVGPAMIFYRLVRK
ncbi:ABC transporter substrate-binding protein [Mesorhizobium soli]|uniref:ABC transporter substrate-binding protein n=2 Tax=Pseudaminobacter soli (ex Li et al. 2025) TaxID=1295366 RepID=A0A2P7S3V6_9HYPH|nr:ABC transporter substrate-binding protein [Mesorhizobium soli]